MKYGLSIALILVGSIILQGCQQLMDSLDDIGKNNSPIQSLNLPTLPTQGYANSTRTYVDKACRYANRSVSNRAEAKANAEVAIKAANDATHFAEAAHKAAVQARKDDPTADEGYIAKTAAKDAERARKCANSIRGAVLNMKPDTVAVGATDTGISAQDLQGD